MGQEVWLRDWYSDCLYHETQSHLATTDFPWGLDHMGVGRGSAGVPLANLSRSHLGSGTRLAEIMVPTWDSYHHICAFLELGGKKGVGLFGKAIFFLFLLY